MQSQKDEEEALMQLMITKVDTKFVNFNYQRELFVVKNTLKCQNRQESGNLRIIFQ